MPSVIELCHGLPQRTCRTGDTILEEGKSDHLLFILASGAVEILKGDLQITTVSEPGSIFGDVGVLLNIPHMATVRTLGDAVFYVVDDPQAFLQAHPEVALAIAALLAKRLHMVTTYLVDLKRQFEGHDDHFGMVDEVLENLVHHQEAASSTGSDRCPDPTVD